MKYIKKVATTQLPDNIGSIIDSFNTTDDKHTNAPSLNAVEQVQKATGTVTKTMTSGDYTFNLTFRRNVKVVTIDVDMLIPIIDPTSTTTGAVFAVSLININDIFPEWAKVSYLGILDEQNIASSVQSVTVDGSHFIGLNEYDNVRIYRNASSGSYMLAFLMSTTNGYPEGMTKHFHLKYIVD